MFNRFEKEFVFDIKKPYSRYLEAEEQHRKYQNEEDKILEKAIYVSDWQLTLYSEDYIADDWEVVGLKGDKTEQINQYIGPMILVQIISNSVKKLEEEGIEALFDTYPEWFKNAICSGKVKVLTIENELIFKVKTFKGEEVNVFLNDFIGKSDVEGEVYPWFYIHLD